MTPRPRELHAFPEGKLAYRIDEAVAVTGIGRSALFARIKAKKIATKKDGGLTLILREELLRYLESLPDGRGAARDEGAA